MMTLAQSTQLDSLPTQAASGWLHQAFVSAMLLTGSAVSAEAAVLESLRKLPACQASRDAVVRGAVTAAIRPQTEIHRPGDEREADAALLPAELRPVLQLSCALRQSYVLRILCAWPANLCAGLLRMQVRQVNEQAALAAGELARTAEREQSS